MSMPYLRPESSVSATLDEFYNVVFQCNGHGPVIHYTPEQIQMAAKAPARPAENKRDIRPDFNLPKDNLLGLKFDRVKHNM